MEINNKSHKARYRKRKLLSAQNNENARNVLGALQPGIEIYLMTVGQFHAINVMEWCLEEINQPVNVNISTWTIARFEIDILSSYITRGIISQLRFITDRSFQTRHPDILADLLEVISIDNIRMLRCHAKFATIYNDDWHLAIRTSANLNSNPRIENYEISDDVGLCNYMNDVVDDIFSISSKIGKREMKNLKSIGYQGNDNDDDLFEIEPIDLDITNFTL